jgi:hypothetical protein
MNQDNVSDMELKPKDWGFAKVWNDCLDTGEERELRPRGHIWASELGGAYVDRWLKMRAEPFTNPPNARAKRKFEGGNLLEWVVKMILLRAGIMQATQDRLVFQYPGLLEVSGKLDFLAGGKPDFKEVRKFIDETQLPEFFARAAESLVLNIQKKFPDGLETKILEVKSCSAMMFDVYDIHGADPKHKLQNFHYLKATGVERGSILYICRDDMRLLEVTVLSTDPKLEKMYFDDIKGMTEAFETGEQPEIEQEIIWKPDREKFTANWKVLYSPYITKLYGYADQTAFQDVTKSLVSRWNRVIGRVKKGDKLTKNNLEAVTEMHDKAFVPDLVKNALRKEGYADVPEETDNTNRKPDRVTAD